MFVKVKVLKYKINYIYPYLDLNVS